MGSPFKVFFRLHPLVAMVSFLSLIASTASVSAQAYKKGEEVAYLSLGKWNPGIVVDSNSKGVLVEYEWGAGTRQSIFPRNEVMYRYEVDAIYRVREWSDASGKFKIRAALLKMGDEKIKLRKPDLAELEIEIAKLSDADKAFLSDLQKKMKKHRIVEPAGEAESFDESAGLFDFSVAGYKRNSLAADPLPPFLRLKSGGVAIPGMQFSDRLSTLLGLGGTDRFLLAAIVSESPSAPVATRLVWASLEQKKILGEQNLPAGEVVLDYHAPSHRLLTQFSEWGAGVTSRHVLSVWEVLPTNDKPKMIARWYCSLTGLGFSQDSWVRFADKNVVIEKSGRQEFVAWNIEKKAAQYRVSQESFFAAQPVLTPGRKFLVMPEDKQVNIYDSVTGRHVSTIPTNDRSAGVAVSDDGQKLAVLHINSLSVWNLTNAEEEPHRFQAEAVGTPFARTLAWIGNEHLMVDTDFREMVLFSLKNRFALWTYRSDNRSISERWAHRVREIVDGHLVYCAQIDRLGEDIVVVGSVELPGPAVFEKEASYDRGALLLVKPGSAVRVVVNAGADSMAIGKRLEQKLAANGWTIDGNAKITVTATMKVGQPVTATYRISDDFGRSARADETVTVTPHISSLVIDVDGKIAWQASTATGPPSFIRIRANQSAQSEANRWNQPQPQFFENTQIPKEILDPKYSNGLGETDVTIRGLIPRAGK
jgi:hypothetical protein